MKEFFNHLKGNWIKYGLETGVVITGILIAFGLSEWADSRKDQSKTTELIISLQNELLQIHDYAFRRKSSVQNQIDLIRYVMTSSTIRMDSISKLSRNLFSTRDDTVYHEKHPIDYLATYIVSYEPRTGVYTTSLNDGSLGLLENLNINHSLSTIYTNNPEQFANIDGTEISINKSLRDHISTKYQKHFEGGVLGYWWKMG